jgi:protein arginine N-methyltransferase 5
MDYMLDWAGHMNIPAVILPPVSIDDNRDHLNYGRYLAAQVLKCSANNVQLWVRVPFHKQSMERYQMLHRLCDGASNLGCMVMFDASMMKMDGAALVEALGLLHQLIGCNLRAVSFPTNVFLTNKRGFPTLPKSLQFLFVELLKRLGRTCRVMVEGMPLHKNDDSSMVVSPGHNQEGSMGGKSEMKLYLEYLRHLRTREEVTNVIDTEEANMEDGYLDHLQSALQPLGDNLEFSTYEVVSYCYCFLFQIFSCLVQLNLIHDSV